MAWEDDSEKTEQPTPRRLEEARAAGQVPRSVDLTAAIVLLTGLVLLNWLGPQMFASMLALIGGLEHAGDVRPETLEATASASGRTAARLLAPFLLILLLLTAAGAVVQTGFVLAFGKLTPKLDHIDPMRGLKQLFSFDSLIRTGMGLLKIALIATVGWLSVSGQLPAILNTAALEPGPLAARIGQLVFTLAMRLALVLLILGLIDYFVQRWKLNKSLKMTKQEVRDELKRMEGDPLVKSRRRQLQQKLALQRIQLDVPRADVVVTNPTEFAVALRYDETSMSAPRVIAKGADLLAQRIRQVAALHGVPIVQRPPLARALYAAVEVGQEVPAQFYRAVAEVLAYVYRIAGRVAATV